MDQMHKELMEPVIREEERMDKSIDSEESNYESADSEGEQSPSGRKRQRKETESGGEGRKVATQYRSVVTDIFDGALQSNVQCLTCFNVSKTKETFQDLSLPIPTSDKINSKTEESWVSWAWWWFSSEFYLNMRFICFYINYILFRLVLWSRRVIDGLLRMLFPGR